MKDFTPLSDAKLKELWEQFGCTIAHMEPSRRIRDLILTAVWWKAQAMAQGARFEFAAYSRTDVDWFYETLKRIGIEADNPIQQKGE